MFTIIQWTSTTAVVSMRETFSPFLFLVILLLVNPSNFRVSVIQMSTPKWNKKFELSDWSYYVHDTQDYFQYM